MRVLMLSWEFPPLVVGGLGRHVGALARELAACGHDVQVVTRGEKDETVDEVVAGVRVRRAPIDPLAIDFTTESLVAWSQAAEHALVRAALPLLGNWQPELVHAHDWLVAQSATTLRAAAGAPLVVTMHATEIGRHHGRLPNPLSIAIDSVERWLVRGADAVIACSPAMQAEVAQRFGPGVDPVVVPNGIDAATWRLTPARRRAARSRWAGEGPLLAFAGRLVHEKGLQLLVQALPTLRRRHPGLRLVVAGTGPYEGELHELAHRRRVSAAVEWLGFAADSDVVSCFAAADAIVVPSTYEPFGIVALEAAATGTPAVLAATGGLVDAIDAGLAAAAFPAGDVPALTAAVDGVLNAPAAARRRARGAAAIAARDYGWPVVARRTLDVYDRAIRP